MKCSSMPKTPGLAGGLIKLDDDYALLHSDKARGQYKSPSAPPAISARRDRHHGCCAGLSRPCICQPMPGNGRKMLRSHGVTVVEYESDYSVAVAQVASRLSPTRVAILSTMKILSTCSSATQWPASV